METAAVKMANLPPASIGVSSSFRLPDLVGYFRLLRALLISSNRVFCIL